jgi:hypothetical protein
MTIKRNGEKVILKGGKVSCSCCEEPEECCMYPAQALVDGGYTVDDLPDEVLYNDDDRPPTLIQKVPDGSFPGGVVYRWPEDGSDDAGLIFIRINADVETSIWEFGDDAGEGGSLCLIQGDGNLTPGDDLVEDQFADTYTVTYGSIQFVNSGSLQRTSLCVWDTGPCEWLGSFTQGWSAEMIYGDQTESAEEYRYKFRIILNEPDPEGSCNGAGVFVKTGDQNSPAGTYSDGLATITVS